MIAIVDYKAGNLTSVKKAFDHLGAETVITALPAQVAVADIGAVAVRVLRRLQSAQD